MHLRYVRVHGFLLLVLDTNKTGGHSRLFAQTLYGLPVTTWMSS